MNEPLLTANEVSALLAVSLNQVYHLCGKPEGLPAYRVGRCLRFKRGEVEDYLQRHAVRPAEKAEPFVQTRFRYVPGMKVV